MLDLNKKIVLVTGASRGIGKEIAKTLINANAFVIGSATTEQGAKSITEYTNDKGYGVVLNVSDPKSIEKVITNLLKDKGQIDVVVNNAGITRDNLLMRMKQEQWNDVINTNLNSLFYITKEIIKPMIKQKSGKIINMGSIVGTTGNAGQANYAAAKAGLVGFTKSFAKEVAPRNICVNSVAPGFIRTDMTDTLNEKVKENILAQIPMNRLGVPKDIANMVCFLASNLSDYITGQTFHVNGGMQMS